MPKLLFLTFAFLQALSVSAQLQAKQIDSVLLGNPDDSTIQNRLEEKLDHLYGFEMGGFYDHSIIHAPDNAFTLFTFEGESCGAYCNPVYEAYAVVTHGKSNEKSIQPLDDVIGPVERIIRIEADKYLIMTSYWGRARSIESVNCYTASLLMLSDTLSATWNFESCTSNLASENEEIYELDYHPETQTITYRFAWYEETEDWPIYIESGSWEYVNGTFEQSSPPKKEYIESR